MRPAFLLFILLSLIIAVALSSICNTSSTVSQCVFDSTHSTGAAATQPAYAKEELSLTEQRQVLWVEIKDFISSATSEHIASAVSRASGNSSEVFSAIILALDTPGGSLDSTLDIIASIQESEVPVIGYVYPQGRSAWSAGTIILIGTDYAAMAPFTTIGSAQPVRGETPVNDTKVINAVTEKAVSHARLNPHDYPARKAHPDQ